MSRSFAFGMGFVFALLASLDAADAATRRASGLGDGFDAVTGSAMVWGTGLICGIVLAFALRTDWRGLSARTTNWLLMQRQRAGLAMLGSLFLAVIVFY